MVRFTEIIGESFAWMKKMLFQPFSFKKWLVLGFIALLAGYLGGGGSGSSNKSTNFKPENKVHAQEIPGQALNQAGLKTLQPQIIKPDNFFKSWPKNLLITLLVIVFGLFIVMFWLAARFNFIFLAAIVNNDASIKKPFKEFKTSGNSLFLFNLVIGLAVLLVLALIGFGCYSQLKNLDVFTQFKIENIGKIILICLPYVIALITFLIFMVLFGFLVSDFAVIIMFKQKIKIIAALKKSISLVKANLGVFARCIFVRIGLSICALIIAFIVHLAAVIALAIPITIIGVIAYLIYNALPALMRLSYLIFIGIIFTPVLLFIFYCLICLDLPFAVFFRTFSIKFIGRLDKEYELFTAS